MLQKIVQISFDVKYGQVQPLEQNTRTIIREHLIFEQKSLVQYGCKNSALKIAICRWNVVQSPIEMLGGKHVFKSHRIWQNHDVCGKISFFAHAVRMAKGKNVFHLGLENGNLHRTNISDLSVNAAWYSIATHTGARKPFEWKKKSVPNVLRKQHMFLSSTRSCPVSSEKCGCARFHDFVFAIVYQDDGRMGLSRRPGPSVTWE